MNVCVVIEPANHDKCESIFPTDHSKVLEQRDRGVWVIWCRLTFLVAKPTMASKLQAERGRWMMD